MRGLHPRIHPSLCTKPDFVHIYAGPPISSTHTIHIGPASLQGVFMYNKLLFLSFLVVSFLGIETPCKDSYVIEIPQSVDLCENGSFEVRIVDNDLEDGETLYVVMPDTFTLSDTHGRNDVEGTVINHEFTFDNTDSSSKTVELQIGELEVGEWSGILPIQIRLEKTIPSNILECGEDLNALLEELDPLTIIFTSEVPDLEPLADVSKAKDRSILLYQDGDTIYISNGMDTQIYTDADMKDAFKDLTYLETVDLSHLSFEDCENMKAMFKNDEHLNKITGIDKLDTSEVLYMDELFYNCKTLTSLRANNWDTSQVRSMDYIFAFCSELKSLNLASWDVSECESLEGLFCHCLNMTTTGDLSSWDVSSANSLSYLFDSCTKLRNVGDLSHWDVSGVRDLSYMFNICNRLSGIGDLSSWDVSQVETFSHLFCDAPSLGYGDLSGWNVSDHCTDLSYMFKGNTLPDYVDLSGWDVSNIMNTGHMFENVSSVITYDISGWDTSDLEDAGSMFAYRGTTDLTRLENIIGIDTIDTSSLKNISGIFYENQYFNADLSSWDTSHLEDISYAFYGAYRFDTAKLKHWNVSNVSQMNEAFGDNAGSFIGSEIPDWYH